MKKFICLIFCLSIGLTCYSAGKQYLRTPIPVMGESIVPIDMQAMIIGATFRNASLKVKGCNKIELMNTKMEQQPVDLITDKRGRYISGNWNEIWSVNACGTNLDIPINFSVDKHGVVYDIK